MEDWWLMNLVVDQADEEESGKRSTLLSTAMALAGVAMVATSVAGSAEAAIQKVEGTERDEQDAVTTGIREPSRISAGKGNTVQEGAKSNTQVLIIQLFGPHLVERTSNLLHGYMCLCLMYSVGTCIHHQPLKYQSILLYTNQA